MPYLRCYRHKGTLDYFSRVNCNFSRPIRCAQPFVTKVCIFGPKLQNSCSSNCTCTNFAAPCKLEPESPDFLHTLTGISKPFHVWKNDFEILCELWIKYRMKLFLSVKQTTHTETLRKRENWCSDTPNKTNTQNRDVKTDRQYRKTM